jgi:hypothetical protein
MIFSLNLSAFFIKIPKYNPVHMNRFLKSSLILVSFLLLSSCQKDKLDLLEGTWEWVNVENINDIYIYEWQFNKGTLTMLRRLKEDPSVVEITDNGIYVLESKPLKTTLQLIDTKNDMINAKWDVIKLTNSQLIMKLDIVGGVLYREFIKTL